MDYKVEDKIVIDERTATIVSGVNVTVDPVVITHGDIVLKVEPQSYNQATQNSIDLGDGTLIDAGMGIAKYTK